MNQPYWIVKKSRLPLNTLTLVGAGFLSWRKFTELVANHVLSHEYRDKIFAIVNEEGVTNEIRSHHRAARPGFDRAFLTRVIHCVDLLQKLLINKRSFFE